MLVRKDFSTTKELFSSIRLTDFPYLSDCIDINSEMYTTDSDIKYTTYLKADKVVAVIGVQPSDDQLKHILIIEVHKDYRKEGIGREALTDYMSDNPYWNLYSRKSSEGFYRKLGFKKERGLSGMFYYGYDL